MPAQRIDRELLSGRIEARHAGLRDQQRGIPGRVEPYIEQLLGLVRAVPSFQDLEQFQGRIARQQRCEQGGGGRGEILFALLQLLAQVWRRPDGSVSSVGESR